jgi:hypothetical protein
LPRRQEGFDFMGYSQSCLAVRGKTPETVRNSLDLKFTGENEEYAESRINGIELPGGWYAIISNHDELRLMEEESLRRISADCEVVACFVEEHCMESTAVSWRQGQRIWLVTHNSQKSKRHFESSGELPPGFAEIRDKWMARQKTEDAEMKRVDYIFEIPVEVAHAVTGYRHDRNIPGLKESPYEILEQCHIAAPVSDSPLKKKSWLQRIFGQ